jgi:hypothetical protein
MKYKIFGIFVLIISVFFFFIVIDNKLEGIIFLMGMFYGIVAIFHNKIERVIISRIRRPLFIYGFLVFLGGMLIELTAYISNIPKIQAGEKVYLFSTNLFLDLLIGFPHYVALGLTWAWLLKRYKLSAFQQAVLIGLFWAIVVDEFSHFFALLSGNILDFIIIGLLMVYALNWPLVILQNKIDETYPNRNNSWTKFPIAFLGQIVPMIVLMSSGILLK